MKYMIQYDIDGWKKYHKLDQKTLVKKIIKILQKELKKNDDGYIEEFMPTWYVVEALKKSVGLKYNIPEQHGKKFLLQFCDYDESQLIPIDKIDWND